LVHINIANEFHGKKKVSASAWMRIVGAYHEINLATESYGM